MSPSSANRVIRDADPDRDAAACAAIYAPYVAQTTITFELLAPDAAELAGRIRRAQQHHAWLVGSEDGVVVGYAYGGRFATRAAYDWACETSVYLAPEATGRGWGTALYQALLARLAAAGMRTAVAIVTQPNPASAALHHRLGFEPMGVFPRVGWKFGAWHDVAWLHKRLRDDDPD